MARSLKQRRKRDITIGIIGVGVLLLIAFGPTLVKVVLRPVPPGYAEAAPAGDFISLDWKVLQQGAWPYDSEPTAPDAVRALEGKPVMLRGFMLPLHNIAEASEFFLAPQPKGCYYCNPPGMSEVVQVEMVNGVKLAPVDWAVTLYGTFHIATGAETDKALYIVTDAVVVGK